MFKWIKKKLKAKRDKKMIALYSEYYQLYRELERATTAISEISANIANMLNNDDIIAYAEETNSLAVAVKANKNIIEALNFVRSRLNITLDLYKGEAMAALSIITLNKKKVNKSGCS